MLKGLAKFQGQQTALSTAQRILEPTIAEVKQDRAQEVKPQLAHIRAGQANLAISRSQMPVDKVLQMDYLFDLETTGVDKLLKSLGKKATFNINTPEGRKDFIEAIKTDLFPMFPREFFFSYNKKGEVTSSIFTASNKNYGLSMSNDQEAEIYNVFKGEIFNLGKPDADITFGKDRDGAYWE